MALLHYPEAVNGIPLSERSRHLLYAPLWMLLRPKLIFESTPVFTQDSWIARLFREGNVRQPLPKSFHWKSEPSP